MNGLSLKLKHEMCHRLRAIDMSHFYLEQMVGLTKRNILIKDLYFEIYSTKENSSLLKLLSK